MNHILKAAAAIARKKASSGGSFSPADLSPDAWFDDTGSDPLVWSDISGNGRHATSGIGIEPAIIPAAINGLQARRFTNATPTYYTMADLSAGTIDMTFFSVGQRTTTGVFVNYQRTFSCGDGTSPDYITGFGGIFAADGSDSGIGHVVRPPHLSAYEGMVGIYAQNPKIGINTNGAAEALEGDLSEIIIFMRALTPTEFADVSAWLTAKYAL